MANINANCSLPSSMDLISAMSLLTNRGKLVLSSMVLLRAFERHEREYCFYHPTIGLFVGATESEKVDLLVKSVLSFVHYEGETLVDLACQGAATYWPFERHDYKRTAEFCMWFVQYSILL